MFYAPEFLFNEMVDAKISGILFFMISHIIVKFPENKSSFGSINSRIPFFCFRNHILAYPLLSEPVDLKIE